MLNFGGSAVVVVVAGDAVEEASVVAAEQTKVGIVAVGPAAPSGGVVGGDY